VYSVASIFTMLYKPRMAEVALAMGALGDDRDLPFGWAMRVSDTGEVGCRDVLEELTADELRRGAVFWQLQEWERLEGTALIDALCEKAAQEARAAPPPDAHAAPEVRRDGLGGARGGRSSGRGGG
jgi:hypothetical protein